MFVFFVRFKASNIAIIWKNNFIKSLFSLVQDEKADEKSNNSGSSGGSSQDTKFCRALLPDGSTTVIFARPGPTIYNALSKLCERRNMLLQSMDVSYVSGPMANKVRLY